MTVVLCAISLSACAEVASSARLVCDGLRGPLVALADAAQVDAGPETMHALRRVLVGYEAGCAR